MANAEQIKALIASHLKNDKERFVSVALQVAAAEARRGHTNLAQQIRKLVDSDQKSRVRLVSISRELDDLIAEHAPAGEKSSLVLPSELSDKLSRIVTEYHSSMKLAKHGLANRRKILLSGPPGTGKTMTAAVLANKTGLPFFVVQIDRLVTKYLGETSAKLRQIFAVIRERPGVYLFDEFDAIGSQRGAENDVGEMRRVLNSLLQFIEGDDSDSLIVAATNSLSMLDMALFRRFDDVLHYKRPGEAEVDRLLRNRLGGFLGRYKLDRIIATALGLSHSEITLACDDAIKETILSDRERITQKSLLKALKDRKQAYGLS